MKATFKGVVALTLLTVPSILFFCTVGWIPWAALSLTKLTFGDDAAKVICSPFNTYYAWLEGRWFTLVAVLLELLQGTAVAYTVVDGAGQAHLDMSPSAMRGEKGGLKPCLARVLSPPSGPGKAKIIMVNHHCRLDWLYLFLYCVRGTVSCSLRIVLKDRLRQVPFFGLVMEHYRFLFLSRSWENDEAYIKGMVDYYKRTGESVTILIFVEGSDLSPSNVEKSQEYAKKAGLPVFTHVLNPRTTGILALKDAFGPGNLEEIIDCTMGYTYAAPGQRPSEPSLIDGTWPRRAHVLFRRYRLDTATALNVDGIVDRAPGGDDAAFKAWVSGRFREKDLLLSRFYANNPVGFDAADVRAVLGDNVGVLCNSAEIDSPAMLSPSLPAHFVHFVKEITWARMAGCVLLFFVYPALIFYHYRWYYVLVSVTLFAAAQDRIAKRFGNWQQVMLIDRIPLERTLYGRLMARLNKGKSKKN